MFYQCQTDTRDAPLLCFAGPDWPFASDVWAAWRGAAGHGGEQLWGDGGHSWCRAVWLQNFHELHPRNQRGVSWQTAMFTIGGRLTQQMIEMALRLASRWVAYSHVDFSGNQYILEKGFYNNSADWGSQDNRICSIQPILPVRITGMRKTEMHLQDLMGVSMR